MRIFRYVRHSEINDYAGRGWTLVSDLSTTHHGQHAVLMELVGDDAG